MLLRDRDVKHFVLHFAADRRTAFNDSAEGLRLHRGQRGSIQIRLIPEAVAVAGAFELLLQNRGESFADQSAVDMIFRQTANPEIDVVWRSVG